MPESVHETAALRPKPQPERATGFSPLDPDDLKEFRKDLRAWQRELDELAGPEPQRVPETGRYELDLDNERAFLRDHRAWRARRAALEAASGSESA
ncbi:hypothetical protein AA0Z99_00130 [Agrococcus sp. 1P02AA]|uniref:hypothetical protein n=1 Tax=Agrococcus sp. 1P02AA TaxID=3132259 RepID=UPI0039A5FD1A